MGARELLFWGGWGGVCECLARVLGVLGKILGDSAISGEGDVLTSCWGFREWRDLPKGKKRIKETERT